MFNIAVGSSNPAKIESVHLAMDQLGIQAIISGNEVQSGVSQQPLSDNETIQGALNRAKSLRSLEEGNFFDYLIGLEGGIVETPFGMFVCNWGVVINREEKIGIGGGLRVQIPFHIAEKVREGTELGKVLGDFYGDQEIKNSKGMIGILTNNQINRSLVFRDVVICAFSSLSQTK